MKAALASTLLFVLALPARAHDGPPYPIVVDWPVEERLISIWADPDVGIGSFYVYVERDGAPDLPADFVLELESHPLEGTAPAVRTRAVLPRAGEPFQLFAELPFDGRGLWSTRFRWSTGARAGEREVELNVTPPGLGPLDLLWYLFPFLGVGFLWAKALLRRRGSAPAEPPASPSPATPDPGPNP